MTTKRKDKMTDKRKRKQEIRRMGIFGDFCGDTSLHGWQFLPRGSFNCMIWTVVIILSQLAGLYFIYVNTTDFINSGTVTQLESSTEPLDDVFFPTVTICNLNQVTGSWFDEVGVDGVDARELLIRNLFIGPKEKPNR